MTYDRNGFPIFDAKVDLYLPPSAINSGSDAAHFREANRMLGDALRADPGLARRIGLNDEQVAYLTRANPSDRSPPDLTWHHHQDTGRIQLVPSDLHDHFSGGHTGGMRIWGGGR
ncbi:MAG: HNH endonuclease [Rhodospirillales bacterium]|nr:HNH endonuclease [Rhodospirillales bacterium]